MKPKKEDGCETLDKRLSVDLPGDYTDKLEKLCAVLGHSSKNEVLRVMIDFHTELVEQALLGYRPAVQHTETKEVIPILGSVMSVLARKSTLKT